MIEKTNTSQQPSARHTEGGDRFNRTLFATLDSLEQAGVDFALIGGIAASGLGRPRSTHDIDIFLRPEDAEAALNALEKNGFKTERTDPSWLFKAWREDTLVDIIFKSAGDLYFDDEMKKRVQRLNYHGREVPTVSPEDLTIIKCAVHSEVGPHHWHDALAILSHACLDWSYLLKRARRAPRRLLSLLVYAQSNDIWVPNRVILELASSIFRDANLVEHVPQSAQSSRPTDSSVLRPYLEEHIRDALAQDERTGHHDVKIVIDQNRILLRGEASSEIQKRAIEEVARRTANGFHVDNQLRVQILPGPEGSEKIV